MKPQAWQEWQDFGVFVQPKSSVPLHVTIEMAGVQAVFKKHRKTPAEKEKSSKAIKKKLFIFPQKRFGEPTIVLWC